MNAADSIHFTILPALLVPKGLAVAIHKNRVIWFGAARTINFEQTDKWPVGTVLNMNSADVEQLKGIVARYEQGQPMS